MNLQTLEVTGIGPVVARPMPGSPVGAYAAPSGGPVPTAGAGATPVISNVGAASGNGAPTVAWVGVVVAIVLIRVMYEMGAKLE